jgi:hypothetical protein
MEIESFLFKMELYMGVWSVGWDNQFLQTRNWIEIQHDRTNERILNQSQTNLMVYMKKKSKNQKLGMV